MLSIFGVSVVLYFIQILSGSHNFLNAKFLAVANTLILHQILVLMSPEKVSLTFNEAIATLHARGLPPYVEPC